MTRLGTALQLAATLTAMAAGELLLWLAGAALPPVLPGGPSHGHTLSEADPVAAAASVLRAVALAGGAVLLATTTLGILARACGIGRLSARLDRWTLPSVRRLLDGAVGIGLAASLSLGSVPAGADAAAPDPAALTLRRLPPASSTTSLRRLPDAPPPSSATSLRRLPEAGPAPPIEAPPSPPPATGGAGVPLPVQPPTAAPLADAGRTRSGEVVVRPGDSFWRLAERHEASRLGRRPNEREVGAYWQQIVAANRHRLAVPGNPDLIFPGQVLVVP